MLAYTYQVLNEAGFQNIASEDFQNVHDLLTAILIKGVSNQVKRGLHKDYISQTETLGNLKGKIDITSSIKQQTMITKRMVCQYDNFSEDTFLNQILKSTMRLLFRHGDVKLDNKKALRKILLYFDGVTGVDPYCINWSAVSYHRNNATYKMLINICWLVIKGLLLTTEDGGYRLAKFFDDQQMHRLYEKFVLGYYKKEYPQYAVNASYIDWDIEDEDNKLFLPVMKSDITLTYKNKTLIIDTKYYGHSMQTNAMYNSTTFISYNLYQIFTYVKNKDKTATGNVSGVLLYAKTDEEITPDGNFKIGGNRIGVKTLDLGSEWCIIREQLDLLPRMYLMDEASI